MSFEFDNTANIHTDRLLLRKFELTDIPDMLKNWAADPEVQRGYGEPALTTDEEVRELLLKWEYQYRWAIILKETNENIGHVSFCRLYEDVKVAEVEYCISRACWGKGIAPEALAAFMRHTFLHTSIQKLEAFHRKANAAPGRVLQKAGLYPVSSVLRFADCEEVPEDDICYAITREQYCRDFSL